MTITTLVLALAAAGVHWQEVVRAQEAAKAPEAPKAAEAPPSAPEPQDASKGQNEPPATFPAQVEQVIVDVVVTDKKGNPLPGITKDSLKIFEDGQPQSIVSFDAIQVPPAPAAVPAPRPRISTNTLKEERRGRTFVIVFDDIHLSPFMAQRAKGAVADFLKNGVREGDRVTLVASGGSAWWSTRMEAGREELIELTKRLDGRYIPDTSPERMSDYEAMRIHQFRDQMVMDRVHRRYETYGVSQAMQGQSQTQSQIQSVEDPFVTGRASDVYFQATSRNRITLDVLQRSLNALISTKGRKSLILVSEGFIYDPNLDEFKKVIEASRRANTAIYFVNSRGLEGMPVYMTAQFGPALPDQDVGAAFNESYEATEGSDSLSADSGGFTVRNTNDLSSGFKRIADETRIYYLVGYNPTNTARDGKFRKIQVKVPGQKGVQVRARKGYYAPSDRPTAPSAKPGVDPVIQTALDSPYEVEDIPLRMTDYVGDETLLGKAAVLVNTEVDIRNLTFEEKDGRANGVVQFLLVVAHRESGEYFRYDQSVELKLLPASRERITRQWLPITRDFELRPGGYQAKIVVRDKSSGRVGTVIHEFDVPDLTQFRVSTPIITDTREAPAGGGPGGRLAPLARRDFPQGTSLFCQFEVYGAQKDQKSGMPKVSMGYQVRHGDGSRWSGANPTVINPTSLGKLSRMVGFSLEDATPGDYEMVMFFKDELAGKTIEIKEPFTVTASLAQATPTPPAAQ
jgi:VWFA-related protein